MSEPLAHPDILAAALEYAAAGFPVFPVSRAKVPLIKAWPSNATTDADQIREWWTAWPDAMIGMPTGLASRLVVVDYDQHKGVLAQDAFETLEDRLGVLPWTATAETGRGGLHYFFRATEEKLRTGPNALGHGIDFQGEGRFVVVPPSVGENGPYRWMSPTIAGRFSMADVVKLPEEWRSYLKQDKSVSPPNSRSIPQERNEDLHSYGVFPLLGEGTVPFVVPNQTSGKWITAIMREPLVVASVLPVLGIRSPERFRCVIPGHAERKPSASIVCGDNGVPVYRDRHGRSCLSAGNQQRHTFFLGEVYAFLKAKREFAMNAPERCLWSVRLLIEACAIVSPGVVLPALPPLSPISARWAWEGFRLLLECRSLCMGDEPAPFTQGFAPAWCGITLDAFKDGQRWLRDNRYLLVKGKARRANVFVPSDGSGKEIGYYSPNAGGVGLRPEVALCR